MDVQSVDHYSVLGLPSGEEGSMLTLQDISTAYKAKALQLHPYKRPDDPDAAADFQKLHSSYEILKDEKSRKLFDDQLRAKRPNMCNSKKKKRERSVFKWDEDAERKLRKREEELARSQELARIRANSFNGNQHGVRLFAGI